MGMTEEQMPAPHPSPGEGQALRLFDGTTWVFKARGEGYTLLECSAPRAPGRPHAHRDQDKVICVVEGEFSFAGEDGARTLGAGGVASFPRGTVHAFKAVGSASGRCLVVMMPPGGAERFVEEVGVPVPGVRTERPARCPRCWWGWRRCWRARGVTA